MLAKKNLSCNNREVPNAGVIQWYNASLPRKMSRVRASSPAN